MIAKLGRRAGRIGALIAISLAAPTFVEADASAAVPVKLIVRSHFGREVNATTKGDVCAPAKETCQPAHAGSGPGQFEHAVSTAVGPNGNVYVADLANNRVQELSADGEFVLTFGWEVDKTTKGDVCTKASGDTCGAGRAGTGAGQFDDKALKSIAVDPLSGDVYVAELVPGNFRVDKYTGEGQFVWTIGKDVDVTTSTNLCTAVSGDVCGPGVESAVGSTEHAAFKFEQGYGDILAVGGPEDRLYVGDQQRVQEFGGEGQPKSEIPAGTIDKGMSCSTAGCGVVALTVDSAGTVYFVVHANLLSSPNLVRAVAPGGEEHSFMVEPGPTGGEAGIRGLALDKEGHLAIAAFRAGEGPIGLLFDTGAQLGHLVTTFSLASNEALSFDTSAGPNAGSLYAGTGFEVVAYNPVDVAELKLSSSTCKAGLPLGTNATFNCTLKGEANPESQPETEAWFEWGRTPKLGGKTPSVPVPTGTLPVPVSDELASLRPNEVFYYRLAGLDQEIPAGEEPLTSELGSLRTLIADPVPTGAPSATFVRSSSAVLTAKVNPENATAHIFFEYGQGEALKDCTPGASCSGVSRSNELESAAYGDIGAILEVKGLQPGTLYRYRLYAENESAGKTERLSAVGQEASFTTDPAPSVGATTGSVSKVTATSTVLSGAVDPDGQTAIYQFELGLYEGAVTQYGTIGSGSVEAISGFVSRSVVVTGLQPGTTYAYRIKIKSGYGEAEGAAQTFTTAGLPAILIAPGAPPLLSTPPIKFPSAPHRKPAPCKRGYVRNKYGKCVRRGHSANRGRGAKKRRTS